MSAPRNISAYPRSKRGCALFALDSYRWARDQEQIDRFRGNVRASDTYAGEARAYANIVRLLTGHDPEDPLAYGAVALLEE